MFFNIGGDSYQLQAVNPTSVKVISESNMLRMIKHRSTAHIAQIKAISSVSISSSNQVQGQQMQTETENPN